MTPLQRLRLPEQLPEPISHYTDGVVADAAQEVEAVPVTPRDARLDLVLTEREVLDFRGS